MGELLNREGHVHPSGQVMLPYSNSPRFKGNSFLPEYVRRIFHYPQMDLEYTFWQMFMLCFNPSRVYATTSLRKQTKNQWARDDPAFVAILLIFMGVASLSYAIAFATETVIGIIRIMIWAICVDFLLFGCVVATCTWFVSNTWLRGQHRNEFTVEQRVEW